MNLSLILASGSPRRQLLLQQFDIPFEVVVADVDETPLSSESPGEMTVRLAIKKAKAVGEKMGSGYRVLGGDTTVAIDGDILGKPQDVAEARSMLRRLSGATHQVYSGVALYMHGVCRTRLSTTNVTFYELSEQAIEVYCNTDDPYDKAGGYGIQSGAGEFVSSLDGSYSGVVGLPLWETHQLLFGK